MRATDHTHHLQLLESCKSARIAIKGATTINDLNTAMIQHLATVSFLLMGAAPNHWDSRHFPGPRAWDLARFRTINYSQTLEQKVQQVLDLARLHSAKLYNQMLDELVSLKNNPNRLEVFLRWVALKDAEFLLTLV